MSHDFEPTDAEKEMLSYMKDIEVNQKQTELGEIISGAILDGQNQIHDLYREKATSQQIEYRMRRAYVYWMDRLNKANDHQLQKALTETTPEQILAWLNHNGHQDIALALLTKLRNNHPELQKAREEERERIATELDRYAHESHSSTINIKHLMEKLVDHSELNQDKN